MNFQRWQFSLRPSHPWNPGWFGSSSLLCVKSSARPQLSPSSSRPLHGRRTSPPPLATAASSTQLQLWRQTTTTTTWSPHGPCELGQRMPTIVTTTLGGHVHPPPKMMPTAATALVDLVERTKSSLVKMGRIGPCRPYILPQGCRSRSSSGRRQKNIIIGYHHQRQQMGKTVTRRPTLGHLSFIRNPCEPYEREPR